MLSASVLLLSSFAFLTKAYVILPPSADAFYQPPLAYTALHPGSLLRSRKVPTPSGINATIAATYQLLYRSTDSHGRPNAVVTTVFVPPNADATKLFSMQDAYDSAAIDCAPSYQLYQNLSIIQERTVIGVALSRGWYVSVPDYEGFTSAFTNGVQSGQAVLDSLRAVLNSENITGLSGDAKKVLAGGSGGALASEWALELQPDYAPELEIDGTLLTSLTPNVTSVLQTVDGTIASGLIPLGVLGMAKQYPKLSQWLSKNLVALTSANFLRANTACGAEYQITAALQDISLLYFGRPNALFDEIPLAVFNEIGVMGLRSTPRSPIYSYKGVHDEISPVADTDSVMAKYCEAGASILYQRATNANHQIAGAYGFDVGLPWLEDRLNGVPVESGCTIADVTVPLSGIISSEIGQ